MVKKYRCYTMSKSHSKKCSCVCCTTPKRPRKHKRSCRCVDCRKIKKNKAKRKKNVKKYRRVKKKRRPRKKYTSVNEMRKYSYFT